MTRQQRFGKRLRAARRARGLTQVKLAKLSRTPQTELSRLEGGSANVGLVRLLRLADALDVSLDWLAGRTIQGGPGNPQRPSRGRKR